MLYTSYLIVFPRSSCKLVFNFYSLSYCKDCNLSVLTFIQSTLCKAASRRMNLCRYESNLESKTVDVLERLVLNQGCCTCHRLQSTWITVFCFVNVFVLFIQNLHDLNSNVKRILCVTFVWISRQMCCTLCIFVVENYFQLISFGLAIQHCLIL